MIPKSARGRAGKNRRKGGSDKSDGRARAARRSAAPSVMEWQSRPGGVAPVIIRHQPGGFHVWKTTVDHRRMEFGGVFPTRLVAAMSVMAGHHRFEGYRR